MIAKEVGTSLVVVSTSQKYKTSCIHKEILCGIDIKKANRSISIYICLVSM